MTCKEITELATDFAEGSLDPATRRSFEVHVAGCSGCAAWVRQLRASASAARELPAPQLSAALSQDLMRRFDLWQAARSPSAAERPASTVVVGAARGAWLVLPALGAAAVALVAMAKEPSHAAVDWLVALGLAGAAVALFVALRRLTTGFAVSAGSASLVAALLRGSAGSPAGLEGAACSLTEAAMALGAVVLAWLVVRRGPGALLRSSLGAWAVAGALVGDAALQLTCAERSSLAHLLVFHSGGVLVVAAAAWAWARREIQLA